MRRSLFDETMRVCVPRQLARLVAIAATQNATTPADIARRGLVKELAALGVTYSPSNDNGEAPHAA